MAKKEPEHWVKSSADGEMKLVKQKPGHWVTLPNGAHVFLPDMKNSGSPVQRALSKALDRGQGSVTINGKMMSKKKALSKAKNDGRNPAQSKTENGIIYWRMPGGRWKEVGRTRARRKLDHNVYQP